MPVCDERKFIFIHIPKNGGSSITRFFDFKPDAFCGSNDGLIINNIRHSPQHQPAWFLKKHPLLRDRYDEYFKFSFVRNPYTRVVSEYFWQKKIKRIRVDLSVEHFSSVWLTDLEKYKSRDHHMTQTYFLYENGVPIVDFIGRLENIDADFKHVLEKINYPDVNTELKIENKNHRPDDVEPYYTQEIKERIYNLYKEDFINFNYTK